MTDPKNILTPDEIKDTTELQLHSLMGYMQALGYHMADTVTGNNWFTSFHYSNKARTNIAFSTAVDIYNNKYADNHGNKNVSVHPFDFNQYRLHKAQAAKIVNFCNLQMSKKTGFIKTTSNIVKFTKPEYYQMWISSKHFPF